MRNKNTAPCLIRCWSRYNEDYEANLARSVFCLVVRGAGTWTHRLFEAMLATCLPVFLFDAPPLPFPALIDWGSFAVFAPGADLGGLEGFLDALLPRVPEMQAALQRDACWVDYDSVDPACSPFLAALLELDDALPP